MKNLVLVGALGLSLVGCAAMDKKAASIVEASKNPLKEYSEIIDVQDMPKEKIFDSSKQWLAKAFKSSNNVIQYADASSGTIIGKGNIKYPCQGFNDCLQYEGGIVQFTLTIDTKDNKAKLSFSDLSVSTPTTYTGGVRFEAKDNLPIWEEKPKQAVTEKLRVIVKEYEASIKNGKSSSDW